MDAASPQRDMDIPSADFLPENQSAQYVCAISGRPSLWVLSLGRSRESISAIRPKTDLDPVRDSDSI